MEHLLYILPRHCSLNLLGFTFPPLPCSIMCPLQIPNYYEGTRVTIPVPFQDGQVLLEWGL